MKKIKQTASELKSRWNSKTPQFWKKVQRLGIIAGALGTAFATAPITLPAAVISLSGYLILTGTVAATLSQLTVEK
jgi:hypothetical protein